MFIVWCHDCQQSTVYCGYVVEFVSLFKKKTPIDVGPTTNANVIPKGSNASY